MAGKPFESTIQDLVYNVDVGIGVRLTKLVLYLLFVGGIALIYQGFEFKGLKDAEAMDFAQLGRNLSEGEGFTTRYIRPASMWYLMSKGKSPDNPQIDAHPDLVHPPLYPALLGLAFKTLPVPFALKDTHSPFPPEPMVILPLCHLLSMLTGLFIFLIGKKLFETRVAFLATTAYFLSDAVWAFSISGTSIPLATLMVSCALYFALRSANFNTQGDERIRKIGFVVATLIFCAMAFLTRYGTVVLVPAIALFIGYPMKRRGWIWSLAFIAAFMLLVSPWLIRNHSVSGGWLGLAPYTALNDTNFYKEDAFERTFSVTPDAGRTFRDLQMKWLNNMGEFYENPIRTMGNGIFACLFIAAFFYRFVRQDVHIFRWCAGMAMVMLVLIGCYFGESTIKLLHAFLPIVLVYGAAFFFLLLDRLQFRAKVLDFAVIGIMLMMTAVPLTLTLLPPRAGVPYPPYFAPFITQVSSMLGEDELMCSDMPWATAWYGHRTSMQLPVTLNEFYKVNDYHKRVSGLYLTNITRDKPYIRTLAMGPYRTWFPIQQGQTPPDFPLTEGFPLNYLDQLFLTDRIRW